MAKKKGPHLAVAALEAAVHDALVHGLVEERVGVVDEEVRVQLAHGRRPHALHRFHHHRLDHFCHLCLRMCAGHSLPWFPPCWSGVGGALGQPKNAK